MFSAGSFLIQQVNSSTPPALINTHHQLADHHQTAHQQPLIQLTSPDNQMIIFNQQQSAIVAQPLIGHLQHPHHPALTIAAQMQTGCQNQINDIHQTVSESVTVQTKLVQQSITEKSTISSRTEENVSISLVDYCNTTISNEPEKNSKIDFCAPEPTAAVLQDGEESAEAIVSHDASNQTDLQTEDETVVTAPYQHVMIAAEESKGTDFAENPQDCYIADRATVNDDGGQSMTDPGSAENINDSAVLSIPENSTTAPDITGLELLLNSIEQFEKRNSTKQSDNDRWEVTMQEERKPDVTQTVDTPSKIEETEEKGVSKIGLLLLAEQFLETEKSGESVETNALNSCYSNDNNSSSPGKTRLYLCLCVLMRKIS